MRIAVVLVCGALLFRTGEATAQWDLPARLELTGPAAQDRQVKGIAAPMAPNDAVSLDAARRTTYSRSLVSGSASLTGQLSPAPSAYTTGMLVTIIPSQPNDEEATLDLNGLGPRPIVKTGNVPLAARDLLPGIAARLVYDGTCFQLLSASHLPCPPAHTAVSSTYCIEDAPHDAATFFTAAASCTAQGGRLCTISEWSSACSSIPTFFGTVITAEWVDHAANNANGAKLVGVGEDGGGIGAGAGCVFGGQSPPQTPFRYRCCTNR